MLGMKDAVFLAVSTPLGSDNWLSEATTIKDENGEPYFAVTQVGLVCNDCLAAGVKNTMEPCEHRQGINPAWKSKDRAARMAKITSMLHDEGMAMRENQGIIADSGKPEFDKNLINRWFDEQPTINVTRVPERIYITIDPDAGGGNSQCAIVSGYRLQQSEGNRPVMTLVVCINV